MAKKGRRKGRKSIAKKRPDKDVSKSQKAEGTDMPPPPRPLVPDPSTWQPQDNNGGRIAREHAAQRRRFVAATQSGAIEPLLPLRAAPGPTIDKPDLSPEPVAQLSGAGGLTADTVQATADQAELVGRVTGPPIPIVPTLYPREPGGAVTVQNHVTINVRSDEFRELNGKLDELLTLLRRSNEISGEVRDQLAAEIAAGKALLTAPKIDPSLIELLLKRPLTFIVEKASGAVIAATAIAALGLVGKLTGLW
jgi:hypothetical protein